MRFKTSVSFAIAIVLGLITTKVGLDWMKKYHGTSGSRAVVVRKDIEPGYVLQEADVAVAEVPTGMSGAKSFRQIKEVIGRTVVKSVASGYPLTEAVLAPAGSGAGIQAMIPPGMRAVTVDVSESSGVAGLLVPGCKVDVIATLRNGDQQIARPIVENVKVQFVQRGGRISSRSSLSGSPDAAGPVKTVTLLVTPKQASAIELANAQGKPRLVLRGNADGTLAPNDSMSDKELLGLPDEPKPPADVFSAAPPETPKGRPVQIIRGGKEETISYDQEGIQEEGTGATTAAGKGNKAATGEPRTASGTSSDQAPSTDAGRGTLR